MAETLDRVVGELKTLFGRMAEGDLSEGMHTDFGGDFAVIRDGAEQAIERLGRVIGTIVEAANSLSRSEERRVGKACVSTVRTRGRRYTLQKTKKPTVQK